MKVELITIGNELLSGKTTDTNSAWLAQQLNLLGLHIKRITSVSDTRTEILDILEESGKRAGIIILTGGLGPTSDDITKPALCEFFNTKIVFRQNIYDHILSLLSRKKLKINEFNKRQAEVPESAEILHNRLGTAAGLWLEKDNSVYISMPGVPFEMKGLFAEVVVPKLKSEFSFPFIYNKTVITQGSFEAFLAEKLFDFESELPENINLAYLPSPGIIKLRFSTSGPDKLVLESEINRQIDKLKKIIPEYIVGYDEDTLEFIIGMLLKDRDQSLSVAESCTGGKMASLITGVPGSSEYFKGGIIAYSNEIKEDQLAISPSLIDEYGAVSKQVVEDMAVNSRLLFNTDYSIAVSGIAGPSGGSEEKPVGTTWIAVSEKDQVISREFRFGDNRQRNIQRASISALNMLRKLILKIDIF